MKISKLLLVLLCVLSSHLLAAHEMWIESNAQGKVGAPQEVKVFFGEFSWGKPTSTAKWFSDIADCKLVLTSPDGKTQILEKAKEDNCYKATFTPTEKGIYKLSFVHEVKDVYKEMKLTYVSAAIVNVDAPKKGTTLVGEGHYQLQISNAETAAKFPAHFTVMEAGKAYSSQMVEVSNTDSATRNLTTDKSGYFEFPKDWKGGQLIQLAHPQKLESSKQHNGKEYTSDYTVFTYYTKP